MDIIGALIGFVLLVISIGGLVFTIFFWPKQPSGEPQPGRKAAIAGSIFGLLFLVFLASVKVVGAGEIGIVKHFGAVDTNERAPGLNIVAPFITDIVNLDGRVQGIPFDNLAAASKEYQDVFLTGVLNVHVQFDKAAELYQSVGTDYKEKLIIPFYTNIVKEVVPQFGIAQVLPQREVIRKQTVDKLRLKLEPYGIVVDDVALANIGFNENYNNAIQDKQIQELRIQTERNILEQKRIVAEQAQIAAEGEANANIERAKGVAEANRLISQSLSDKVLLNNYIDKLADDVKVMLVPGGQEFLLDLKNLLPTAQP